MKRPAEHCPLPAGLHASVMRVTGPLLTCSQFYGVLGTEAEGEALALAASPPLWALVVFNSGPNASHAGTCCQGAHVHSNQILHCRAAYLWPESHCSLSLRAGTWSKCLRKMLLCTYQVLCCWCSKNMNQMTGTLMYQAAYLAALPLLAS